MLAEGLASGQEQEEKALFAEFEKALHIASSTIEKLQEELEKASFINLRFKQDLKGLVLSQVLSQRLESLTLKHQNYQSLLS